MRTAREAHIDPTDGVPHHALTRYIRRGRLRALRPQVDAGKGYKPLATPYRIACEWCLPWSVFTYPGHLRGLLAIFGRSVTIRSVSGWKFNGNPPVWAASAIRDYIRHRCEVGLGLVDQLNAYIDERERAVELKHQRGRLRNHRPADE